MVQWNEDPQSQPNPEIAKEVFKAIHTAKTHISQLIKSRLNVNTMFNSLERLEEYLINSLSEEGLTLDRDDHGDIIWPDEENQ